MKNNKDFEITYTRGSGPGGQHKNKVETCVVIEHIPSGLTEKCQDTRSKQRNLKLVTDRINKKIQDYYDNILNKQKKEKRDELIRNSKVVRAYNFSRNEVYDHRRKVKADLKKVLNGNIDLLHD